MSTFNPKKLSTTYKNEIAIKKYELPRKYTLTHSDMTGDLFLTIGKDYDYEKVGPMRDEVLAEWGKVGDENILKVSVQVDGDGGLVGTIIRDKIFREELPLALSAIVYGDGLLMEGNKNLYDSKIIIKFNSRFPEYNLTEEWGYLKDYKYEAIRQEEYNLKTGFNHIPYPYPYPPIPPIVPIPIPKPFPKPTIKNKIVEDALITMLEPYIRREVTMLYGRKTPYCLKTAKILQAEVVSMYSPCTQDYEVIIGLRVGKNPPQYNNLIIKFLINVNVVKVLDVKTPRS